MIAGAVISGGIKVGSVAIKGGAKLIKKVTVSTISDVGGKQLTKLDNEVAEDGLSELQEKVIQKFAKDGAEEAIDNSNKELTDMNFIVKRTKPFDVALINDIEATFNIQLPKALKKYYLAYGNSSIKTCQFKANGFLCDVAAIISIDINDAMSFYKVVEYGRSDGWIPDNYFPFAHDSGGNYYFWDSISQHVYLIFNDNVENPYEICESLEAFFKLLKKG